MYRSSSFQIVIGIKFHSIKAGQNYLKNFNINFSCNLSIINVSLILVLYLNNIRLQSVRLRPKQKLQTDALLININIGN